ncbi:hypothetical protein CJI97_005708 [Candidozyma auris]|nr:hypothetical protein CJI97_005708 [[Candida] auris]
MGNSPSKNDPLPNSPATSNNGASTFESLDLDSDDTVPPLSRPTGNVTPSVGPKNIPRSVASSSLKISDRKSPSGRRDELGLEVDISLATALNGSAVRSPKEWLAPSSYQSTNSSSSIDSSNGLSVFTNGEVKDESSISSVSSNSPVNFKGAPFLQKSDSLDPIQESSSSSSSPSFTNSEIPKARKSAKSNDSQASEV